MALAENILQRYNTLNINSCLLKNPANSFLIRVAGNSMINAGINSGDTLIVDRTIEPQTGKIVIASINNHLIVKKIIYRKSSVLLESENINYKPIKVSLDDKFEIWGVVTSVIKSLD